MDHLPKFNILEVVSPFLPLAFLLAALSPPDQLARDILEQLININTDSAHGTTTAAEAVAARLRAAGLEVQLVGDNPRKKNLVTRIRGSGARRPVLFIGHLDVVDARREDWSFDPFRFREADGWFYGRGTSDMKGDDAILVANFIRLKQENYRPDRDLILALTADEENGSDNGIEWLVKHRRDLIDAEYALNCDAGGGAIQHGRHVRESVQVAEKTYLSFRLEVRNKGGHSSLPVKDNAIYHLSEGLARLAKFDFPVRLMDVTRAYFERMAALETPQNAADMKRLISTTPPDPQAVARFSASPYYNALMRTTCVATRLEAGHADNALPQLARAVVNCRILPAQSIPEVQQTLVRVLADEQIQVTKIEQRDKVAPASPLQPEVMKNVEAITQQMWPGVPVIPGMGTGATDSKYLREGGIPAYGVTGMFADIDDVRAHGRDERMGVKEFYEAREFLYRLIRRLSTGA
jgi:acetylornithine deacetylase/succinyl-diaminopimelate desuccinylase-like protein